MHENTTPVTAEPDRADQDERDDGAGTPNWAGAMAQIDAEIDELRALLARRRAADEAHAGSGGDAGGSAGSGDAVA